MRIEEGDFVIIMDSKGRKFLKKIENKVFSTHLGNIDLYSLIGKEYGSTTISSTGNTFFVYKPSLVDFMEKSKKMPQVIYPKDASIIIFYTGIGPNSRVLEAGSGSGSLTMALAYYVRPSGRVYSYEIREQFLEVAKKNVTNAGLLDYVDFKLKDAREGIDEKELDTVILDMPDPWHVFDHAYRALKPSGFLVLYTPTVTQLMKILKQLEATNFSSLLIVESLMREYEPNASKLRPKTRMVGHSGYIIFARKIIE
ncbi:MAG: tRNA (adenine-N1)-methyltransferase [Candidatus Hydrothermarchaeota archaeon]